MIKNMNKSNDLDRSIVDLENHWAKASIFELIEREIIRVNKDNLFNPEERITTEQFVTWVIRSSKGKMEQMRDFSSLSYIDYALQKSIMEDYDRVNRTNPIERRRAARIVHETLLSEFNEKDEQNWPEAKKLKDIYSCRTCVQHIAQVYVKGIMEPEETNVFNVGGSLTRAQAATIVLKMIDRRHRVPKTHNDTVKSIELDPKEAKELLDKNNDALLLDVRSSEAYKKGHIAGSISLSLETIHHKPDTVHQKKDSPIILYCQKGYKSDLAADHLINAGYNHVYTIPGIDDYTYNLVN